MCMCLCESTEPSGMPDYHRLFCLLQEAHMFFSFYHLIGAPRHDSCYGGKMEVLVFPLRPTTGRPTLLVVTSSGHHSVYRHRWASRNDNLSQPTLPQCQAAIKIGRDCTSLSGLRHSTSRLSSGKSDVELPLPGGLLQHEVSSPDAGTGDDAVSSLRNASLRLMGLAGRSPARGSPWSPKNGHPNGLPPAILKSPGLEEELEDDDQEVYDGEEEEEEEGEQDGDDEGEEDEEEEEEEEKGEAIVSYPKGMESRQTPMHRDRRPEIHSTRRLPRLQSTTSRSRDRSSAEHHSTASCLSNTMTNAVKETRLTGGRSDCNSLTNCNESVNLSPSPSATMGAGIGIGGSNSASNGKSPHLLFTQPAPSPSVASLPLAATTV
ncbi:unnamed protein product [Protopolystoma xenopodis]|uniref:Uncharacterized protein n=1 Tax=Protopolystoma xenopodis TaxID=117903 RepID=A0A3S4ZKA9_9PLAT|nr:unnamed protein product [Protopolystoma xenopodis]